MPNSSLGDKGPYAHCPRVWHDLNLAATVPDDIKAELLQRIRNFVEKQD